MKRIGLESWSGVELRHLVALVAIHEEQSFRGAADRLGYVQSAVSQRLSQLETVVGERLVHRAPGHTAPVTLTETGLLLLEHARSILSQLAAAQGDLRAGCAVPRDERPTVRVGIDAGVARRLAPTILAQLGARQPDVTIEFLEAACDRAHVEAIALGTLDAAFAELPLGNAPVSGTQMLEDPCVLVVRPASELAMARTRPTLGQLATLPLITLAEWPLMRLIDSHVSSAGWRLHTAMRVSTSLTAQALVAAGAGAAILPRLTIDETDPAIATIDLSHLLPNRRLAFCWHERRRNLAAIEAVHAAAVIAARKVTRGYEGHAERLRVLERARSAAAA